MRVVKTKNFSNAYNYKEDHNRNDSGIIILNKNKWNDMSDKIYPHKLDYYSFENYKKSNIIDNQFKINKKAKLIRNKQLRINNDCQLQPINSKSIVIKTTQLNNNLINGIDKYNKYMSFQSNLNSDDVIQEKVFDNDYLINNNSGDDCNRIILSSLNNRTDKNRKLDYYNKNKENYQDLICNIKEKIIKRNKEEINSVQRGLIQLKLDLKKYKSFLDKSKTFIKYIK